MMGLARIASGLLAAFLVVLGVKAGLSGLHYAAPNGLVDTLPPATVLVVSIPLSVLGVALAERLKLRHILTSIAAANVIALIASASVLRQESIASSAFAGGAFKGAILLISASLGGLAYWLISGRKAGWSGVERESAAYQSEEAFRTASANARYALCWGCVATTAAVGILVFGLIGWAGTSGLGLRSWLLAQVEEQGEETLKAAGFAWAKFKIDGKRGIVSGLAPDDAQKRFAFDSVRDALSAVTGFPGIIAQLDNESVARMPMAAVDEQLAASEKRENEARVAAEAARVAAESARAAEVDARQLADQQARQAQEELKLKLEEQARAAEGEMKRKLEEQARLIEAEIKRQLDEQRRNAESEASASTQVGASSATETAPAGAEQPDSSSSAEQTVAAIEPAPSAEEAAAAAGNSGDSSGTADNEPSTPSGKCTPQDIAIVESSRVHFEIQRFEVDAENAAELDRLASSVRACTPRSVQVIGYADASRDSVFNPALALQRAESVRAGLISRGVPAGFVMATAAAKSGGDFSFGGEQRSYERRAEFRLVAASEVTRDATLDPEQRATTCESELSEIMAKSIIHFPLASARISPESGELIGRLATAIQKCGSVIVTVEGHTDKLGAPEYNQGLSEMRANAVREALVASGADATRLATKGFAASRPYAGGETREALALNRRIEFRVSGRFSSTSNHGP